MSRHVTNMKSISDTLNSTHPEITMPDIDENIIKLSITSGIKDDELERLKTMKLHRF